MIAGISQGCIASEKQDLYIIERVLDHKSEGFGKMEHIRHSFCGKLIFPCFMFISVRIQLTRGTMSVASSSSSLAPSNHTISLSTCGNCDNPLRPSSSYHCSDCDAEFIPACSQCAIDLHRPIRSARHRLIRRDTRHLHIDDPERIAGHGFCSHCQSLDRSPNQTNLAVLECEGCEPIVSGGQKILKSLCLDCDLLVHQSLDSDAHIRLTFEDTNQKMQTVELFPLAGCSGLQISHMDAMESYAGRIWPGSMMLARYLEQIDRDAPGIFQGKRMIELGCGCAAIPSITCWLLGASSLVCTDMNTDGLAMLDENIVGLKKQLKEKGRKVDGVEDATEVVNIAASSSSSTFPLGMSTRRLAFGDACDSDLVGQFDIILGSYILYDPDSFAPLVNTLDQLVPAVSSSLSTATSTGASTSTTSTRRPLILLTSHEPTREHAFLSALEDCGFLWTRVPFSLQTAELSDEAHAEEGKSQIGTGLRSTSILRITRGEIKAMGESTKSRSAPRIARSAQSARCRHLF
jgi:predicted nicotinamide N-methyase